MPRFQLQIREPGSGPRLVPIVEEMTLGHARRADVRLEDPDVGNELFRVGEAEGVVFVEGLSRAGLLRTGDTVIEFGQRVPLAPGAILSVGRTTLSVVDTATAAGSDVERTMVSSGGYRPGTPKPAAPLQQQQPPAPPAAPATAAGSDVERTMVSSGGYRPGTPKPAAPPQQQQQPATPAAPATAAGSDVERTMVSSGGYRPGTPKPAAPPQQQQQPAPPAAPATAAGDDVERTMVSSGGYRPGTPRPAAPPQQQQPAPPTAPQPAAAPHIDKTQVRAGGYRPGTGAAAPQPPSPGLQPVAPPPPTPPRAQEPPPPQPVAAAEVPLPAKAHEDTIVTPRGGTGGPARSESLEARCKATNARLFLKSDSIKRTIRLVAALNHVGRLEGAEVWIPNKAVSERHAEIRFDGANWQLQDCGSTNGTTLDGATVALDPKPMHNNSFVTFGIFRAVFLCHDAEGKDRPLELRAVRWLAQQGKLSKQVAQELTATCRNDPSLSVAEVLLRETPVDPSDWGDAMQAARKPAGPVGSILSMLTRVFSR